MDAVTVKLAAKPPKLEKLTVELALTVLPQHSSITVRDAGNDTMEKSGIGGATTVREIEAEWERPPPPIPATIIV